MANRVIKDTIWTSPTLARLSEKADDSFPRWLLMADDWGCFNSDSRVIKGLIYPFRDSMTVKKIEALKSEYYMGGVLLLWSSGEREWGYFVSFDSHHNYCNKTNANEGGERQKSRRKTPEPPQDLIIKYLEGNRDFLGQVGTSRNKMLNLSSSYNSSSSLSLNPNLSVPKVGFNKFWEVYPKRVSKGQAEKAWLAISPDEQLQSRILVAIELAKTSESWTKDGGRYIPHPATWLRAKGWEDEHKPNLNGGKSDGTKPDPYAELYE